VNGKLFHHSDRGNHYPSIRYTERLAEEGVEPSARRVGDSYDNALAGSMVGLFKPDVVRRPGRWLSLEAVQFATVEWVDWFNSRRLLEPIGNIPPVEFERAYYDAGEAPAAVAGPNRNRLQRRPGRFNSMTHDDVLQDRWDTRPAVRIGDGRQHLVPGIGLSDRLD
jgi:hypothetical protein